MTFRFIHTADWQLGKPFANFPPDLAGELAAARFTAIARIASVATKFGARHVLVAGDIFDSEDLPNVMLRRALERMAEHTTLTWILLPGNHDPARTGGVWDRAQRLGVPANVLPVLTAAPVLAGNSAVILPAPLTSKNPGRDPSHWMDDAATSEGSLRIGLAHGSVQGFGSDGESSVSIARDRAAKAGLNYLALGDWHGATRVGAETWYSGTPEPDRFPNNEPGFVLAVTAEHGSTPSVEKIATAHFTWAKAAAAVNSTSDLTAVESSFGKLGVPLSNMLVSLQVSGSLSLTDHTWLDAWCETWSARLRHLLVDRALLAVRPISSDFDSLGSDVSLLAAARRLAATASDSSHPDHAVASLALQRLFGFAAEASRSGAT